jgi:signal transduction histidine kinase
MSHQLFTPRNAIIGVRRPHAAGVPRTDFQTQPSGVRAKYCSAGQRALAVFRDVVMLAELEADRFPLILEEMDLREAARAAVADFVRADAGADRLVVFEAAEKRLRVNAIGARSRRRCESYRPMPRNSARPDGDQGIDRQLPRRLSSDECGRYRDRHHHCQRACSTL